MLRKQIIGIIVAIVALGAFIAFVIWGALIFGWLQNQTQEIVLAIVMAIIAGLVIEYIYRKFSPQSKILKTTQTHCAPNGESMAQLILPNNNNIIVDGAERVLGREDFVGVISTDKLLFIGKDHLKITRKEGCFYIQDLNTKNGTMVNGEKLHGSEKRKLEDGDEILMAQTLRIKYNEQNRI